MAQSSNDNHQAVFFILFHFFVYFIHNRCQWHIWYGLYVHSHEIPYDWSSNWIIWLFLSLFLVGWSNSVIKSIFTFNICFFFYRTNFVLLCHFFYDDFLLNVYGAENRTTFSTISELVSTLTFHGRCDVRAPKPLFIVLYLYMKFSFALHKKNK